MFGTWWDNVKITHAKHFLGSPVLEEVPNLWVIISQNHQVRLITGKQLPASRSLEQLNIKKFKKAVGVVECSSGSSIAWKIGMEAWRRWWWRFWIKPFKEAFKSPPLLLLRREGPAKKAHLRSSLPASPRRRRLPDVCAQMDTNRQRQTCLPTESWTNKRKTLSLSLPGSDLYRGIVGKKKRHAYQLAAAERPRYSRAPWKLHKQMQKTKAADVGGREEANLHLPWSPSTPEPPAIPPSPASLHMGRLRGWLADWQATVRISNERPSPCSQSAGHLGREGFGWGRAAWL